MSDCNAIGSESVKAANLLDLAESVSCGNRRGHVEAELLERDAMSESFILGPCVGDDVSPPS